MLIFIHSWKKTKPLCQSKTKIKVAPLTIPSNSVIWGPLAPSLSFSAVPCISWGSGQIIQTVWHILNWAGQLLGEIGNIFLEDRQVNGFVGQTGGSDPWLGTGKV